MIIKLSENNYSIENIIDIVSNKFGLLIEPYNGPTFIMPDGLFLDLRKYSHHSDVEKFLIDSGLSNNAYVKTAGSRTLSDLGCIRCDTVKYYIALSLEKQPTGEQYNSLLIWLDYLQKLHKAVEVITPDNQNILYKFDSDTISDTVVDRIRRYYYSGKLYEQKVINQKHQHNFIYDRNDVGKSIMFPY